jgi:hypothetical protein
VSTEEINDKTEDLEVDAESAEDVKGGFMRAAGKKVQANVGVRGGMRIEE